MKAANTSSHIGWIIAVFLFFGFIVWQWSEQPKRELATALNSFFSEADELAAMTLVGTTRNDFATKLSKVIPRYDTLDSKLNPRLVPYDDYKELKWSIFYWKATAEAWNSDDSHARGTRVPLYMSKASDIYHDSKNKLSKYAK